MPVKYVDNIRYYYSMMQQATTTEFFATLGRPKATRASRDPI